MANSKVRCAGCRDYVYRVDAVRVGNLGWSCSDLCSLNLRERSNARKRKRQILSPREPSQKLKEKVKERDGHRCRWCGRRSRLEVHHIFYLSAGGPNADWNLIVLCLDCHAKAHSDLKQYRPLLLAAQWLHYVENMKAIGIETTRRHLIARGIPSPSH